MTNSHLIDFYLCKSPDSRGRMMENIWQWDSKQLENVHDYIQWLFPLKEKSNFNMYAPILRDLDIKTFRASAELKNNLLKSFQVMLHFYGLKCIDNSEIIQITTDNNFDLQKDNWLNRGNHNHLRITRILNSLVILGLETYARAFFLCLSEIYQREKENIDIRSFNFWKNAVG